jgi:hypothetical protein
MSSIPFLRKEKKKKNTSIPIMEQIKAWANAMSANGQAFFQIISIYF